MGKDKEGPKRSTPRILHRLKAVDYNHLIWKQLGFGVREFELTSGETLVGRLYWPKWLSDYAVAECGDGRWGMDRVGFFRDRGVALEAETGIEVASVTFTWMGDSELTLSNGRHYQLFKTGILSNNWSLVDENEEMIFEIREGMRLFKHDAEIDLQVGAIMRKELPLLILLSWYLAYMQLQDAAAAAAAVSAAS
jgi:hypothetical protein